jgi:alpha-galactosidase
VWARQSLGTFSRRFEAKVRAHDTLLLLLSRTGAAGSPENKVAVAM